jgi:hypothetical protein
MKSEPCPACVASFSERFVKSKEPRPPTLQKGTDLSEKKSVKCLKRNKLSEIPKTAARRGALI